MRTISLAFREAMNAQETGEVPVVLLTITHPDLASPIYLSSDATTRISEAPLQYATASRGRSYLYMPFVLRIPDDIDERAPAAEIQVENVSRSLVALVRSTPTPPSVTIELVLASSPDVVEVEWPAMGVQTITYDAMVMTLQLGVDALVDEPYPAGSFAPSGFPGLF